MLWDPWALPPAPPSPTGCMTLGESLGLGLHIWTMGPCPALPALQVGVGISRKERVGLWDKMVLQYYLPLSPRPEAPANKKTIVHQS